MKEIQFLVLVLFSVIMMSCNIGTKSVDEKGTDTSPLKLKTDTYLEAHTANNRFSGKLFVAQGDSVLYSESFGLANRAFGIPNTDSTKYLIGSITKPFTAYAILLLAQKGKLALKDKLFQYFPTFPEADKITIEHLLTHRSGIADYHSLADWETDSKLPITPEYVVNKVAKRPLDFPPGERFRYSNTGYILLGLIIEKVSGTTFESFVQREILDPLELVNTGIIANDKIVANLAVGYSSDPREVKPAEYINYNQPFSSGNMYSTPEDLWKFTKAVMRGVLLDPETSREIFTVSDTYGYGWGIRNYDSLLAYGHHGGMNGFVGSITYIPEKDIFMCFLTNDDNTPKFTLSNDVVAILTGKEVPVPDKIKLVKLTPEMQRSAVGRYLIKEGDTLNVFTYSDRLYLQETGQIRHELFPVGVSEYVLKLFDFKVSFTDKKNGCYQTLKFVGNGNLTAKRISNEVEKQSN